MFIAICDDDKAWAESARDLIQQYMEKSGTEAEVLTFFTSEDLLAYRGQPLDVVFLDIEFKGHNPNGIETARAINNKWNRCQVVFMTNYISYAMDAYETRHSYFVVKEQFGERLSQIFKHLFYNQEQHIKKLFFVCVGQEVIKLAPDEIYFFERSDRKTNVFTVWGIYQIYDRIEDLCKRLPADTFTRCHNSFLVYIPHITRMKNNIFYMTDGHDIPISRRYMKTAKQDFNRYVLSQVR